MEHPFVQRDIGYTIISRLEESIRLFLSDKLTTLHGSNFLLGIPEVIVRKVIDRTSTKDWDDPIDFLNETEFKDLKDIIIFQPNYDQSFKQIIIDKQIFESLMLELYCLRCKIAHVRGYFTSTDLDMLVLNTQKLVALLCDIKTEMNEFLKILFETPEKVVMPLPYDFFCDEVCLIKIPNNLPVPDYEYEGGFVGRNEDINAILKLIESDRYPVVTLSGAGGVGKTALAIRLIETLLNRNPDLFDGIIWLSAKEQQLSYLGIEDIEPTFKNYEELLDTIIDVIGFKSPGINLKEKEDAVNNIFDISKRLLIIIDNLETITDERIITFILEANPKIKILVTSRKGLGQVERRYDLKQLKEKEAIYMFRQVAKDKKLVSLARLDDEIIKNYVKRVNCYPLAIKWVIGKVAIGKDINDVVQSIDSNTSDISLFCFDQIYDELSENAKKIICALSQFDESPSAGILKYMVNLEKNDFEDGIKELILVSFVIPEQYKTDSGEISSKFSLLTLTRGYVRKQLDKDSNLKRELSARMQAVRSTVEEAERAKKQYRFTLSDLGANTDEEKIAALIERTAYQKWSSGRYIEAFEDYKRAVNIAPRFANLYRNWAFIESEEGHLVEADKLMEKAVDLSPNDPAIWLVWGNMKRKYDRIKEALFFYEKAYELLPNDCIILNSLGQAKARLGFHEEADKLYRTALDIDQKNQTKRHEIINRTSIADNLQRWAESDIVERNYDLAEEKLIEAKNQCKKAIVLDTTDKKTRDQYRKVIFDLGRFYFYNKQDLELAEKYLLKIKMENAQRYVEIKDNVYASYQLGKLYYRKGEFEKAKAICSPKLLGFLVVKRNQKLREGISELIKNINYELVEKTKGNIISINSAKGFCIIESLDANGDTYLGHINDFDEKIGNLDSLYIGQKVTFCGAEYQGRDGVRKRAERINIELV